MRLVPDSLFWRLFVAILGVVIVTLLIILGLIVRERREFALLGPAANAAISNIAESIESLAKRPPEERTQAIEELREQRRSLQDLRRARITARRESREILERAIVTRLQETLGSDFEVRAIGSERLPRRFVVLDDDRGGEIGAAAAAAAADLRPFALEVVFPDGESISFRMPAPRPGPQLQRRIFFDFGLLTLTLGIALYAMTRTITRPLGKLAKAADAVGRGLNVEPLPEEGGRELRAATRAFNAMQERLRRYLDSRTRVLAAMSHDMRTPLTRLRLRVESIEDEQLRAKFNADLDEMNAMIQGALGVFRGLNDDEAVAPIDINELLTALRDQNVELGHDVMVSGRALEPYIGKPLALKRCLGNLIQNAIQYGHQAQILVEDGAELVIRIRDRGPGIPPEALSKVFEPFFRLEGSRNRDTGGMGLGLSIARDIVQAHGGTLTLKNLAAGLEAELVLPRPKQ
ncbi:MAG TPA: ATP-binding protein [Steroidobacteraceae bacterium]